MNAPTWLTVSPRLRDALGPGLMSELEDMDPLAPLTCQVCGKVKRAGSREPMAVIAAAADNGGLVVGFAHRACHSRVGDIYPALLDRAGDENGLDAQAFFGVRSSPEPRALLAFEPQAHAKEMVTETDGRDPYVAGHLAAGFTLVRDPLPDIEAPVAPGWTATTGNGMFTLEHVRLGIGYQQQITHEVAQWLDVARLEGRILVVTGTQLGISPDGGAPSDFAHARRRGLLVAATVPLTE